MTKPKKYFPKPGESVEIKAEVKESFYKYFKPGGMQGRVVGFSEVNFIDECRKCKEYDTCEIINNEKRSVDIEFDSISLKQLPKRYIKEKIITKEDFAVFTLFPKDLIPSLPRDTIEETKKVRLQISSKYHYVSKLDVDDDFLFHISQAGLTKERAGIAIQDVPYFLKAFSKKTIEALKYYLNE